jgi:hypothetical protein
MQKIIFKLAILICILVASFSLLCNTGGPTSTDATGSPLDSNQDACTQCHQSYSLNSGTGSISLSAPSSYYPGQTYTITATVAQSFPVPAKYGFQLVPLRDNNTGGGAITAGSGQGTWTSSGINYVHQDTTTNNTGFWSFTWTAPSYSDTIKFYAAGLAADGANGNQNDFCYTTTATILPLDPIEFTLDTTNVSCFQGCDGQASVTVSGGGIAPYTYLWSTGATTSTIVDLCVGNYSVTITDSQGNNEFGQIEINEPNEIQTLFEIQPSSCAFGTGQISVQAFGGAGAFTYLWNDTANTTDSLVAPAGVGWYSVIITDTNGCILIDSAEVIGNGSGLNAFMTSEAENCHLNNGEASITMLAGNPPYSYQWNQGSSNQTVTALSSGNYTVTVTDFNGCMDEFSLSVGSQFLEIDEASSEMTPVRCFNGKDGSLSIEINTGEAPFSYNWSHDSLATNNHYTNLEAGNYQITVTDYAGCLDSISITVTQPDSVYATITIDSANEGFCDGAISFEMAGGTPPYSYQWPHDNIITTNSANELCSGSYLITTTDAVSCLFLVNTAIPTKLGLEMIEKQEIIVYPNPATNFLYINNSEKVLLSYQIYDVNGNLILNGKTAGTKINLGEFSSGNYMIAIEKGNLIYTRKFVIRKS